jgi:F-type H+-transporting ATPase subunit b
MAEKPHTAVKQSTEHAKAFAPLDPNTFPSQLLWVAISFGVLYLLVRRVILPRVGEVVEDRRNQIERDLRLTEKIKSEAATALDNYNLALANGRSKANDIAMGMRQQLEVEANRERERIEGQIAAMVSEAENHITAAKSKAIASIDEIAIDVARTVVSRLIGSEVTTEEVKRSFAQRAAE